MPKQILSGSKLREKILSGVQQLADPVTSTMGGLGRNVGVSHEWTNPTIINDGVTVARAIDLPDIFENFAAQAVKQAAEKTNDMCGDGTSGSVLLTYEILKRGIKEINNGLNPVPLVKGMNKAVQIVFKALDKKSLPINTQEQMEQVAIISSSDSEIGKAVGKAVFKTGRDGVVSSEVHAKLELEIEYKEGLFLDKGFMSSQFVNNPTKEEVEILNPRILITDHIVTSGQEMASFLEQVVKGAEQKEVVIISSGIDGSALLTMLANNARGNISSVAIYAPGFAERRKEILGDIAVITGGTFFSKDSMTIDKIIQTDEEKNIIGIEKLGRADSVFCTEHITKIIGGYGDPKKIQARADMIREQIKNEKSDFEKEQLRSRLARLVSGAAIIKIGGRTEIELSDRKERVIDAIGATKVAVENGIVAGGGIALLSISNILSKEKLDNKEEQVGLSIIAEALQEPSKTILRNAGKEAEVFDKLLPDENYGYNVVTEQFGDMVKMGVIDPARVIKEEIQNATSVAGALLLCEYIICKIPEEPKQPQI